MKIAFIGKRRQSLLDIERINRFMSHLEKGGAEILIESRLLSTLRDAGAVGADRYKEFTGEDFAADIIAGIGGDGTLLRCASTAACKDIPIIGFNTGHLGFLADESLENASEVTARLFTGDYAIESRSMLEVSVHDDVTPFTRSFNPFALNEVAISRQDTASMISVDTRLDGMQVADYQGDGIIISTPTGSTAYNLSVGGPVIEPDAPAFVISPIAPHALTMRPLVVSHYRTIDLAVSSRSNSYRVSLDGRTMVLPLTAHLTVKRARAQVRLIHFPGRNFFDTLRTKMLWGVTKR